MDGINSTLSVAKVFTGTDPAANAEIAETVPTGKTWVLLAVHLTLVQGSTQTPQPILTLGNGVVSIYRGLGATNAQSASTTARYTWAPGMTLQALAGATTNVHGNAPLPSGLQLQSGWTIGTTTIGIGANTDYGAPVLYVIEYG